MRSLNDQNDAQCNLFAYDSLSTSFSIPFFFPHVFGVLFYFLRDDVALFLSLFFASPFHPPFPPCRTCLEQVGKTRVKRNKALQSHGPSRPRPSTRATAKLPPKGRCGFNGATSGRNASSIGWRRTLKTSINFSQTQLRMLGKKTERSESQRDQKRFFLRRWLSMYFLTTTTTMFGRIQWRTLPSTRRRSKTNYQRK